MRNVTNMIIEDNKTTRTPIYIDADQVVVS